YKPTFRREGVFHEIETLAARSLIISKLEKKEPGGASGSSDPAPPASSLPSSIPGYKKLTQMSMDPEDAVTLRSRVIRFNYLSNKDNDETENAFSILRKLVDRVSKQKASEKELTNALRELAALFASPYTSVSSFELLQSGVI